MKVNGIKLREALRKWQTRIDVATKQFPESLWQFPNDNRKLPSPTELSGQFKEADRALAAIQVAQQQYNLANKVEMGDHSITLSLAIKLIGNAGRHEKMWRQAATDNGRDRYSYRENVRKTDDVYAERQVSVEAALNNAEEAAQYASTLRTVIAVANAREIDIDIDPKYFE